MTSRVISPGKRSRQEPLTRFQRLWSEAEEMARKNRELEKELDTLVRRIDAEVLKAEREMGEVIRLFVHRQLKFARSRSLLKWQRAELNNWMADNLSQLVDLNLLDDALENEIAWLRAWELGIELDPDSELSPAEQLERYLEAYDREEACESKFDTSTFDEEERRTEDELEELLRMLHDQYCENQERPDQADSDINAAQGKPVDAQVFNRLFRQTAAALHPDREQDDVRRQEKNSLMSQLLKARKERDLITLVLLHERYAAADSELSSDDQAALEGLLINYLSDQRRQFEQIIHRSPIHHLAYTHFYHARPATVTSRINAHVSKTNEKRQSLIDFMAEVKTLKVFKEVLAVRHKARRH